MQRSVYDTISQKLAPLKRQQLDLRMDILGTKTNIMRIAVSDPEEIRDIYGRRERSLETNVINNVIISYPFNEIETFTKTKAGENEILTTESIDINELLPIEMIIPFSGEYAEKPIALEIDDFVIDVFFDEHGNKIPILMQITRPISSFYNKYLIFRKFELSLHRGPIEPDIELVAKTYVETLNDNS